jgi:hypothetical protein
MTTSRERSGLRGLIGELGVLLHEARDAYGQTRRFQEYFASLANSYPLLAECPRELLEEEAGRLGIPTHGRSKLELARAVFEASRQGRHISAAGG